MPTPKGYYCADGGRVPSVTTINGRFKDSGPLIKWANKQGLAGIDIEDVKREAADIGTAAHAMVEQYIKGQPIVCPPLPEPDQIKQAYKAFEAYLEWAASFQVKIVWTEGQLISETWRYGGTPDAIGVVRDRLCILDWKTSNDVYEDYLVQLAAYRQLWNENFPDRPLVSGGHLLRFSKEWGDFTHRHFTDLDEAWEQFLAFRQCYERSKNLKRRAK